MRRFGPRYVAADVALRTARRVGERMEDTMLDIEGARGVFGPAHRAWRDNSSDENRRRWNRWDWSRMGEEWTASEEWKQALVDEVLLPTIPPAAPSSRSGRAAGAGACCSRRGRERLVLVDVAQRPLDLVAERLRDAGTSSTC